MLEAVLMEVKNVKNINPIFGIFEPLPNFWLSKGYKSNYPGP
jgi:hypothetical protein